MKEFIYRLTLSREDMLTSGFTRDEERALAAHSAYVDDLISKGTALFVGRTDTVSPDTFGIVVFQASSEKAAREVMARDPGVSSGVQIGELFPFRLVYMAGQGVGSDPG